MFKLVSNTAAIETAPESTPASAAVQNAAREARFCIPLLGFRDPASGHTDTQAQTTDAAPSPERKNGGVAA